MKKGMKRLVSGLLALAMVLTTFGVNTKTASAEERMMQSYVYDGCEVDFDVTDAWDGAFNAEVKLANTGDAEICDWALTFEFAHEIQNLWNATVVEHTGNTYVIKNVDWNANIKPGESVTFGMTVLCDGEIAFPENFSFVMEEESVTVQDYSAEFALYSDWGTGCNGAIILSNLTDEPIENWQLEFDYDREIVDIANAIIVSHEQDHYVIKNAEYNADIAAKSSVHIGIVAGEGVVEECPVNFTMQQTVAGDASTEEGGNGETTDDGLAGYFEYGIRDIVSFYNPRSKKITLMMESEKTSSSKSIYARYDDGVFVRVAVTEDSIFYIDDDAFASTGDFMIVETDELGNKKKSLISSFIKDVDGIKKVVIDSDTDKIPDAYEVLLGTDSENMDTDGDGFGDGYELLSLYTDPLVFTTQKDTDGDGVNDYLEMVMGSNPYLQDSDFDGIDDNEDEEPLNPTENAVLSVAEDIPVLSGKFDYVSEYINENGEKCKKIYNWLTDSIKLSAVGEKKVVGLFDEKSRCIAMVTITPSASVVNTYSYSEDRLKTVMHHGNKYEFSYDENGNLVGVRVGEKNILSANYINNRIVADYTNDSFMGYTYNEDMFSGIEVNGEKRYLMTYDDEGNLVLCNDIFNGTEYEFVYEALNGDNILKSVESSDGFKYEYQSDDNIYRITYSDGEDQKTQSFTVTNNGTNSVQTVVSELFTDNGMTVSMTDGHSAYNQKVFVYEEEVLVSDWNFGINGVERIWYQDGKSLNYDYDTNANLSVISESGELRTSYEYDDFNQLIRENNYDIGKTFKYAYDDYGNICSVTEYPFSLGDLGEPVKKTVYGYSDSSWNDLLTEFDGQNLQYDGVGNPIVYRDGMNFEWDAMNKLTKVTQDDNNFVYSYSYDGTRVSKEVNGVITSYNMEQGKIINSKTGSDVIWFVYDENDMIIGMEYNGEAYYFEKNSQMDVERIFNSRGELVSTYSYDAYGNIVSIVGNEDIARLNPFRYRSYYYDEETGFYCLNARYYDPKVRRFINADSVDYLGASGSSFGYNLFTYCENNPIMFNDASGNVFTFNSSYEVSGVFEKNPIYDPSSWFSRQNTANCYAYALNMYGGSDWARVKLQPGELSGRSFKNRSETGYEAKLIAALRADLNKISRELNLCFLQLFERLGLEICGAFEWCGI